MSTKPGQAHVASAAFPVRHIAGVIDRLFTYARGEALSDVQRAALAREQEPAIRLAEVPTVLADLAGRVDAAVAELKALDPALLGVWRAQLPSTTIG